MKIEEVIAATLERWHRAPFSWATDHCDFGMADYVLALTGRDPAAWWRGRFCDEAATMAHVEAAGGNLNLVTEGMASIGIEPRQDEPQRGDVVVVNVSGRQIAGLYLDPFTALRMERGVLRTRRFPILRAWRCG